MESFVCVEPGPVPADYLHLAEDLEFRSLLTMRRSFMWLSAKDHENARAEADEILAMIRVRLEMAR